MLVRLDKRGQTGISQLPNFFQIMMLVVIFAGLTFIILDKFIAVSYDSSSSSKNNETVLAVTEVPKTLVAGALRSCSASVSAVKNSTTQYVINSGNYTVVGCTIKYSAGVNALVNNTNWNVTYSYTYLADTSASNAVNETANDLYDYGIGFLGIVILVIMVYLIISIVSGRKGGAR